MLRVKLDDRDGTWLYIDPATAGWSHDSPGANGCSVGFTTDYTVSIFRFCIISSHSGTSSSYRSAPGGFPQRHRSRHCRKTRQTSVESLERSEKRQQCGAIDVAQALESAPGQFRLSSMSADRFLQSRGAIVQKRAAEPQAPERRRSDFVRFRRALLDAVAGSDVMEQKV